MPAAPSPHSTATSAERAFSLNIEAERIARVLCPHTRAFSAHPKKPENTEHRDTTVHTHSSGGGGGAGGCCRVDREITASCVRACDYCLGSPAPA